MNMFNRFVPLFLLFGAVFSTAAMAQERDWRGGLGLNQLSNSRLGPEGPIREGFYSPPDEKRWRTGHWVHDWHEKRFSWWWVVDPFWYAYPQPVYPYPTYVAATPPQTGSARRGRAAVIWYYCDSPSGYFPSVRACSRGWYKVAATLPARN